MQQYPLRVACNLFSLSAVVMVDGKLSAVILLVFFCALLFF
jgi:hypothetical protein